MRKYWLSCKQFTVQVNVNAMRRITFTAPVTRKFLGQPLTNLTFWVRSRFGSYQLEEL